MTATASRPLRRALAALALAACAAPARTPDAAAPRADGSAPAAAAAWAEPVAPHPDAAAPDVIALAAPKDFADAVAAVERATGATGGEIEARGGRIPLAEGRSFALEPKLTRRLLQGSHETFRKAGFYLFRYERSFGLESEKDLVGLLATPDRDAVVRRMGTAGPKRGITTEQIVAWLDAMHAQQPFTMPEVGVDFVRGWFRPVPSDAGAVAMRCAEIAPDLVAGNPNMVPLLVEEIRRNGTLMLIWE
jgi:hypothetical protein